MSSKANRSIIYFFLPSLLIAATYLINLVFNAALIYGLHTADIVEPLGQERQRTLRYLGMEYVLFYSLVVTIVLAADLKRYRKSLLWGSLVAIGIWLVLLVSTLLYAGYDPYKEAAGLLSSFAIAVLLIAPVLWALILLKKRNKLKDAVSQERIRKGHEPPDQRPDSRKDL